MRKQLLFAVVLLASTLAFAQETAPAAVPQFAQTWADFAKAINAKDPAAVAALFATDGEVYPSGGDIVKGRAAIEQFYKLVIDAGTTVAVTSLASQASGPLGYETGLVALTIKDPKSGKPIKVTGKYVSVFVQENGAWKVKYLCYNPNPGPKRSK
jgi:uncharacterized protein (TIGR02246 family)